jgi:hypothetical protein
MFAHRTQIIHTVSVVAFSLLIISFTTVGNNAFLTGCNRLALPAQPSHVCLPACLLYACLAVVWDPSLVRFTMHAGPDGARASEDAKLLAAYNAKVVWHSMKAKCLILALDPCLW